MKIAYKEAKKILTTRYTNINCEEAFSVLTKVIATTNRISEKRMFDETLTVGKKVISDALICAKYALIYQIPKEPYRKSLYYHCPYCEKKLFLHSPHCRTCGQALAWKLENN